MPQTTFARPSSSVILVRDAGHGLETFMVRRHARSRVAPRAYVFPGGTVRQDDLLATPVDLPAEVLARADCPVAPSQAAGYFVCALRELFEEAGVLLVREREGGLMGVDDADQRLQERLAAMRLALQARQMSFQNVLDHAGWRPAWDLLVPFSHWVTPWSMPARFDTRFFVAEMPPRQQALHCTIETSDGAWLRPADALQGDYDIVFATAQHLRRIADCSSVADLLAFARAKPIRRVQPRVVHQDSGLSVWIAPDLVDNW